MSKIEVNQISSQCGSTLTIGQSGDTVTLAAGATQTGFGRTGTVDWCTTAKTAPFTGVSGKGYFVNTTCGAVTVTLPATPSAGDIISIKDYARTAGTNNINFCRNGSKMDGDCVSGSIITDGESTTLIYVDGTQGWTSILDSTTNTYGAEYVTATGGTITCCGDYKIHTFTADGCFSVTNAGNPAGSSAVDYLVVAGGGGGGYSLGGGGGAGGYRTTFPSPGCNAGAFPISATTYPITVGGGGAGSVSGPVTGTSGSPSTFSTITSTGGGGGGSRPANTGVSGGSGGGAGGYIGPSPAAGGTGNTPPTSPPQGTPGGTSTATPVGDRASGGGGASQAGFDNNAPTNRANGGSGSTNSISGGATTYAGGGGGGAGPAPTIPGGSGGAGGGGTGGGPGIAIAGTCNTGGGGGGGSNTIPGNPTHIPGQSGGSGIVIIRYKFQN